MKRLYLRVDHYQCPSCSYARSDSHTCKRERWNFIGRIKGIGEDNPLLVFESGEGRSIYISPERFWRQK